MEAKILVPEMEKKGYSKEFASVITAVSAIITPLIPPGICMILYGSLAGVSIGKLFVAGFGIGLVLTIVLMVFCAYLAKCRGYPPIRTGRISAGEMWKATKSAILPLCIPVFIIGSIRVGLFTPTEAGAAMIVFSLILGFVYKELTLKKIIAGMKETITTTSAILLIVAAASTLSWVFTERQVPQALVNMMTQEVSSKWLFLLIINLFLLFVGMFLEGNAATIILVPLLAPLAALFTLDPIHFAMIFTFNIAMGALTPPMGMLMFVTCSITECKLSSFIKECIPFLLVLLFVLLLLTVFPVLSTGLVNIVF
jgi:tripartite ATP-independent transporter DctM subunit